jgi:antitoxin component YwqK of YwqJK toxin-antitoxin module
MKKIITLLLMVIVFVTLIGVDREDVYEIDSYQLANSAIAESELVIRDSVVYYHNSSFTGIAFTYFDSEQIQQVKTFKDGILNGPMYAWYEDGTRAMQANYSNGYLHGRFLAWSDYGDIVYDIFFDKNQFKFDLQLKRDLSREDDQEGDDEADSDSKESGGE